MYIINIVYKQKIIFALSEKMSQNNSDLIFSTSKKGIVSVQYLVAFAGISIISLLSIINQSHQACGCISEAEQYIKESNKIQQIYYLEYSKFSDNLSSL